MGKRQIRVYNKDILAQVPELLLQPVVQVVLHTNVVIQGRLRTIDPINAELWDRTFERRVLPLQQIKEIIYDKEAAF
ncbi:hypothetical protein [Pontibacter beigongshangensis]|uniref:hypothetical protein n=1 Tax=Pontibacter beigongshangensis TaxID=2574733 RepID=UPI00164F76A7|nr:hypothetical protein [Pontibacter beigongshangensis]